MLENRMKYVTNDISPCLKISESYIRHVHITIYDIIFRSFNLLSPMSYFRFRT